LVAEEKVLMYEKKLAIYEEIIKKCEASKAGVTSASSIEYLLMQRKKVCFFSWRIENLISDPDPGF
jgi:hypothetical protein